VSAPGLIEAPSDALLSEYDIACSDCLRALQNPYLTFSVNSPCCVCLSRACLGNMVVVV
jgi:hypothetical protein